MASCFISGQSQGVAPLTREIVNHLDSGLTTGQPVLSLSKGRNDVAFAIGLSGINEQFFEVAMKEKQEMPATATRNKFDGDDRDEKYWEQRESLLAYQSVQELLKDAGADAEVILETLVSTFLLRADGGDPCVNKKTIKILEIAVPLITAELEQEEPDLVSATSSKLGEVNYKWLH